METEMPLLGDPKFAKALNLIDEIRADCTRGKDSRADSKLNRAFTANSKPTTDQVVLSTLLAVTHRFYPEKFAEIRDAMTGSTSLYSPIAVLTAIGFTLDDGYVETAENMFGRLERIDSICRHEYIHGRICQMKGNTVEAKEHYLAAFRANPYFMPIYAGLHAVDPGMGWDHFEEIVSLRLGSDMTPRLAMDNELAELTAMYTGWLRGDRSNAVSALLASGPFNSGNPFYRLVYAWMCAFDGSYRNAIANYAQAISGFGGNVVFLTEMADIQDRMGDSEDSERACRRALSLDPNSDMATAQLAISQLHQGRLRDSMLTVDSLLKLPIVDARQCARCIDELWSAGRRTEANSLYKRIGSKCSDNAYSSYLLARNDNLNGSYKSAEKTAAKGMKDNPDSIPCICQMAVALSGQGRTQEALAVIRENRQVFKDDLDLLITEKDVLLDAEDYDGAIEVCDYILDLSPRNADVMRNKADAYRLKGDYVQALSCYRESLNIREDIRLFIHVLKTLLESRRTDDLCRLIDDYDDTYGGSALVWRLRGNAEYADGRYEDAALSFSKASEIVSNDLEIWHSKGMAEEKAGLYADAEASYDRAVILDLENADCWISKASVQELRGNILGAIDSLNRVISVNSDNTYALAMKGRLLARLGMYREAEFFLELAYKLDSSNPALLEMILKVLVRTNNTERAIKVGKAVLDRERNSYETMLIMAEIYIGAGDRKNALKMLNDSRPFLKEDTRNALRCAVCYHELMCYNEEIEVYLALVERNPENRDYLMRLAEAYSALGDNDSAAGVYARLEKIAPDDVDIAVKKVIASSDEESGPAPQDEDTFGLAKTLVEGGRTDEGIDIMMKSIDADSDDPEQYLYAAETLSRNGRDQESLQLIDRACATFPYDARFMYAKGSILESRGELEDALASYNDAAKHGMDNHDLNAAVGRIGMELGMLSPAIDALKTAVAEDPADDDSRISLCDALIRTGRREEAVPHLTFLMKENPEDVRLLRMYVTAIQGGSSEGLLSVYDAILASQRSEEDTEFFAQALESAGENEKAAALRDAGNASGFDAESAALDVLDRAYEKGMDLTDASLYEGYGEHTETLLEMFSAHYDYTPEYCSAEFDELERMSVEVVVGQDLNSIECNRVVPLPLIRHATGCASVERMSRLQSHISMSFDISGVPDACAEKVDGYVAQLENPESVTLFMAMRTLDIGIMTARMVLNRISGQ